MFSYLDYKKRDIGPVLYNRKNKVMVRERLPLKIWIENLILYSRVSDFLDKTAYVRNKLRNENMRDKKWENTYASAKEIAHFVDFHEIDMKNF